MNMTSWILIDHKGGECGLNSEKTKKKTDAAKKNPKKYMVFLVDRKQAKMFTLLDGVVLRHEEFVSGTVPQKVKHGDDTWDSQDKIFRHIEDHLHRHLADSSKRAAAFAKNDHITGWIIGGHRTLFPKIKKHIPYPYSRKIKGEFVTELKAPFGEILKRAKNTIKKIEETS